MDWQQYPDWNAWKNKSPVYMQGIKLSIDKYYPPHTKAEYMQPGQIERSNPILKFKLTFSQNQL